MEQNATSGHQSAALSPGDSAELTSLISKLQKALRIEEALERVRSCAMAMHQSNELSQVVAVMYEQVSLLGFSDWGNSIMLFNKEKECIEVWASAHSAQVLPSSYSITGIEHPVVEKIWEVWRNKIPTSTLSLAGEEKESYDHYLFSETDFAHLPEKIIAGNLKEKEAHFSFAYMAYGLIAAIDPKSPLSKENFDILERFAKVFEQTYTRFLDLQKAEAQAREAQIEVAVERVRAEAMAMYSSEDFGKVSRQLLQQVKNLGLKGFTGATIYLIDENEFFTCYDFSSFGNMADAKNQFFRYDATKHPMIGRYPLHQWKKGERYFELDFDTEKLHAAAKEMKEVDVDAANSLKEALSGGHLTHQWDACGRLSNGFIAFDMTNPPDEDVRNITVKMTHAFEQAYIRFLDLQKAEAQAREAQIEAALERVRARTMAMRHSNELKEASAVLIKQVLALGIPAFSCGYNIFEQGAIECTAWMSTPDGGINPAINIPLTDEPNFIRFAESKKRGEEFYVLEMRGAAMQRHYQYLSDTIPVFAETFDAIRASGQTLPPTQIHHLVNFAYGNLMFITLEPCPEAHDIFKRFGKVFEQTYTRFLDLQRAEAQAREAQIEASLERVRSRAMAMRHSDELSEAAELLYNEFLKMGVESFSCGYLINDDEKGEWKVWLTNPGEPFFKEFWTVPYDADHNLNARYESWKRGDEFHCDVLEGEANRAHHVVIARYAPWKADLVDNLPPQLVFNSAHFSLGHLFVISLEKLPAELEQAMVRFAKVFDLTYRRFLDLQKTEARAREAQIEVALERVRARTMSMYKSNELPEAANLLFQQIQALGIRVWSTAFNILSEDKRSVTCNVSSEGQVQPSFILPLTEEKSFREWHDAILSGEPLFVQELGGADLEKHYEYLFSLPGVKDAAKPLEAEGIALPTYQINHICTFKQGFLLFITYEEVPDVHPVFLRFTSAFQQTYTRFLDLQKAEAQAREAQIETALERVRAQTMAMHNSEDVGKCIHKMFEELTGLGIRETTRCGIGILNHDDENMELWTASKDERENVVVSIGNLDMGMHSLLQSALNAWKDKQGINLYVLEGEELRDYFETINSAHGYTAKINLSRLPERIFHYDFVFNQGILFVFSHDPLSEELTSIFQRFSALFGQTYRRYLDLVKAEEQAREAQIEAALERVRSRTMAMHKSSELGEAAIVLFEQIEQLGIETFASGFNIWDDARENLISWMSNATGSIQPPFVMPIHTYSQHLQIYKAWKDKEAFLVHDIKGKALVKHYAFLRAIPLLDESFKNAEAAGIKIPDRQVHNIAIFSHGYLLFITREPHPEFQDIFLRFGRVFEQTYIRFLDLQKAEAQAREAQIEASLERVRSRTMAMNKSDELTETASQIFKELEFLGIRPWTFGFNIWVANDPITEAWSSSGSSEIMWRMTVPHTIDPTLIEIFRNKDREVPLLITKLEGNDLEKHIGYMMVLAGLKELSKDIKEIGIPDVFYLHAAYFRYGYLLFVTNKPIPEAETLFVRFTKVFEQTYTRFLDLKNAEARAKEAVKQASLDRVRAEIASMRSTQDLERITPLVWQELTVLGVPFFRCGVFIIDEVQEIVHSYLSTPEGHSLAVMELPFDVNETTTQVVTHWKQKLVFKEHWDKEQFVSWMQSMVEQHRLKNPTTYLTSPTPPESLSLHFIPFKQGMLYVGNSSELSENEIELVETLAASFSIAYARYEDFKQLEEAKTKVEATLNELKSTQAQLIQSEKMASLGELTAGIAHEIQNPLNFVNNYSEVNVELIVELRDEVGKVEGRRDKELEKELWESLVENENKIHHHGKRADAIVRGMLQHSRTNSGTKEPTDLNAMADEYLRLAYHGLRAKDSTFQAEFTTDFDEHLPLVEVVQQDIGRVLLNIIYNAFQAVNERRLTAMEGYQPEVKIATRKLEDSVEIRISDNGNGIPDSIKDKIFQPFFTTKPTGSGTGLGLSMAYDSVNAQGGKLRFDSQEGNGAQFTIELKI